LASTPSRTTLDDSGSVRRCHVLIPVVEIVLVAARLAVPTSGVLHAEPRSATREKIPSSFALFMVLLRFGSFRSRVALARRQ